MAGYVNIKNGISFMNGLDWDDIYFDYILHLLTDKGASTLKASCP